jgi:hypothetical protein
MSKSDDNMPTTFPKKWAKVIAELPEFQGIADSASPEDLKKIIVLSEGNISNIENAKENDQKLNGAKELVKENSAPYKDAIRVQTAKVKYALFCLESKGHEIGDQE